LSYSKKLHGRLPNEKVERNEELYRLKIDNPKMKFRELGERFEISRSMAHKIYKRVKAEHEKDKGTG